MYEVGVRGDSGKWVDEGGQEVLELEVLVVE